MKSRHLPRQSARNSGLFHQVLELLSPLCVIPAKAGIQWAFPPDASRSTENRLSQRHGRLDSGLPPSLPSRSFGGLEHALRSAFTRSTGRRNDALGQAVALFLLLLFALSFSSPARAETEAYYVPPSQFNAAFQIMDLGFANALGLFQSATGSFSFDASDKSLSHLKIAIDTTSLMTAKPTLTRDLSLLLDTPRAPEIVFLASSATPFKDDKAEVKGTLKFHGQSKPVTFQATLNHIGAGPGSSGSALGLSLRGEIKRAEFGLADEPEMPSRFGQTMTLLLEMQAVKQ